MEDEQEERKMIATVAMHALLTSDSIEWPNDVLAKAAFDIADAMLAKAREPQ